MEANIPNILTNSDNESQHSAMPPRKSLNILLAMLLFSAAFALTILILWRFLLGRNTFILFQYGLCLPAIMLTAGALLLPSVDASPSLSALGFRLKCAALLMLSLSPFPTWYLLTIRSLYFYYCSCLLLAVAYYFIYFLMSYMRTLNTLLKNTALATIARLLLHLWLLGIILPVAVGAGCWLCLPFFEPNGDFSALFLEVLLTKNPLQTYLYGASFVLLAASSAMAILQTVFLHSQVTGGFPVQDSEDLR